MIQGLVIGRFEPPHRGHELLINFARQMSDELTVMVCQEPVDAIPVELRGNWIYEVFAGDPKIRVLTNKEIVFVTKEEDPEQFWYEWVANCRDAVGNRKIDAVFAGEEYGQELADRLGAAYYPLARGLLEPISATQIRNDPARYWEYLLPVARPQYIKKVVLSGPESTGKTTVGQKLNQLVEFSYVNEWARDYLRNRTCQPEDMLPIAKGQVALEYAVARHSRSAVMVCDTDPVVTWVCAKKFFPHEDWSELESFARSHNDYTHTFVFTGEIPYVSDAQRAADRVHPVPLGSDGRQFTTEDFTSAYDYFERPYELVTGSRPISRYYQVQDKVFTFLP